ncbi:50S RIBOSOMAL PROTEIN L32 [Mycoplasmopsis pulmonis]|uniref:Large ribosomal subunit protein bL32 n=1 Tax=Mycoplasmopsis pulmonis (strain UAB CTIP) TaxID=272635 RepID=RL32_MYCPU|nr:50S ribosomal protein L32 [Mycoplasmopsis pulmonis]Q98QN7.1 RecName: Full=Large ribosomal subunit protein bL32; AltName: Full=50S ribosomal protein L32 [Mycoplasmopsis pulmonis UAB CTIP]MDZ7293283.1 50S ribosomal protein L32 [Mycoplasmopsis pulmonis]CAC13497.1 50S RIBOSOMAL PROTEIN L32 [Mycoplasmopsis pulmonis]VEU68088.1 50S ribosomal protein L32 [Mycoplasmopsis pulmonis]
MAIVPKRKTSKQRKRKRQTHDALKVSTLVSCQNCSVQTIPHVTCKSCGFYKGRQVLKVKSS